MAHKHIPFEDLISTHTDRDSLPFPQIERIALKPPNSAYPKELKTIGDHIKKRRLDLSLFQKDVARMIGVTTDSVTYWETGRSVPTFRRYPAIIEFLGYIPFDIGKSIPEQLIAYRKIRGLSREDAAADLGVEESTWWKLETGIATPRFRRVKEKIERVIRYVEKKQGLLQ